MNRLEQFLKELSELTKKHGFAIRGCGCCGSPWVDDFKEEFDVDNLYYDKEKTKYEADLIKQPMAAAIPPDIERKDEHV